jgi:hypothetical protein
MVIAESEAKHHLLDGLYLGYNIYEITHLPQTSDDRFLEALGGAKVTYEAVVCNRRYVGPRYQSTTVACQWDSDPIALTAPTAERARSEGKGHALSMLRCALDG